MRVEEAGGRSLAMVELTLPVQVVREGEVAVYVLPAGTAVLSASYGDLKQSKVLQIGDSVAPKDAGPAETAPEGEGATKGDVAPGPAAAPPRSPRLALTTVPHAAPLVE